MTRDEATTLVELLRTTDIPGWRFDWLGQEPLNDWFRLVRGKENFGAFRVTTPKGQRLHFAFVTTKRKRSAGQVYFMLFGPSKTQAPLQMWRVVDGLLEWPYSGKSRDGRNQERQASFAAEWGGNVARVRMPGGPDDLGDFLEDVLRVVETKRRLQREFGAPVEAATTGQSASEAAPSPGPNYWKLAPGEGAVRWQIWLDDGIADIGWDALGDIGGLTESEFNARLELALAEHSDWTRRGAKQAWSFSQIRPGDRLVANKGTSGVLGIGTVVGPYEFVPNRDGHPHRVRVRWEDTQPRAVDKPGWQKTLVPLKRAEFEEVLAASSQVAPASDGATANGMDRFREIMRSLRDKSLHFSPELVAAYLLALQTKRFVLLAGISGTGKTQLALQVARHFEPGGLELSYPAPDPGSVAVTVMPSMRNHHRFVVPVALARTLLPRLAKHISGRLALRLPDGTVHSVAWYGRDDTRLVQVSLSGKARQWATENLALGQVFWLSVDDEKSEPLLVLSFPPVVSRPRAPGTNWELVAVHPEWTDRRGLLGYYNPLTEAYERTPFLNLLLRAAEDEETARQDGRPATPHFLILDEMNLARVEHYFADFLSAMESMTAIHLHESDEVADGEAGDGAAVPKRLQVPRNLYFVGTVNVDETTYQFSPKVIDRAFTLEFNDVDLEGYGAAPSGGGTDTPDGFRLVKLERLARGEEPADGPTSWQRLGALGGGVLRRRVVALNELLAKHNRQFGYRVADEIARFVCLAAEQTSGSPEVLNTALDLALLQKALPKLHGTQSEVEELLQALGGFARTGASSPPVSDGTTADAAGVPSGTVAFPRMARKVERMLSRLERQGYTSYLE